MLLEAIKAREKTGLSPGIERPEVKDVILSL